MDTQVEFSFGALVHFSSLGLNLADFPPGRTRVIVEGLVVGRQDQTIVVAVPADTVLNAGRILTTTSVLSDEAIQYSLLSVQPHRLFFGACDEVPLCVVLYPWDVQVPMQVRRVRFSEWPDLEQLRLGQRAPRDRSGDIGDGFVPLDDDASANSQVTELQSPTAEVQVAGECLPVIKLITGNFKVAPRQSPTRLPPPPRQLATRIPPPPSGGAAGLSDVVGKPVSYMPP